MINTLSSKPSDLVILLCLAIMMGSCTTVPQASEVPTTARPVPRKHLNHRDIRERAIEQVIASLASQDPFIRANAVETSQYLPDRVGHMVQLALEDKSEAVRFAAAAIIGKQRLKDLVRPVRRLLNDPSMSVYASALFALRRCGDPVDISPMAQLMQQPDATLRGNVAMLLGLLEEPSAIPILKNGSKWLGDYQISDAQASLIRLQIAEAMVILGDESGLEAIRAMAYSTNDEVRILAVQALGRVRDRKFEPALHSILNHNPIELRLAAAGSLAQLGDSAGLKILLAGSRFSLDPVRSQAAVALGYIAHPVAVQARVDLLTDPSEQVRLSAAAAILQGGQLDSTKLAATEEH